MAHSPRGWTGARTPSAIKRVRISARKRVINQSRRSAAKTLVTKAVATIAANDAASSQEALVRAVSALDKAAKGGAIHRNAAARRKSRLMRKLNAALGGATVVTSAKAVRQTGKAAAVKAAKARVAAGKAAKAKGEQTAAGKARAALTKSTRTADAGTTVVAPPAAETAAAEPKPRRASAAKSGSGGTGSGTKATKSAQGTAKPAAAKAKKA